MARCRGTAVPPGPRARWRGRGWRGVALLAIGTAVLGGLRAAGAVRCRRAVRRAPDENGPLAEVIPIRGAG